MSPGPQGVRNRRVPLYTVAAILTSALQCLFQTENLIALLVGVEEELIKKYLHLHTHIA